MSNIGKIFGLDAVYEKKVQNTWTTNFSYGYFVGGDVPSPSFATSIITRIDFNSDTFSNSVSYGAPPRKSGTSSQTPQYGYYVGGRSETNYSLPPSTYPSYTCSIERLDYSNETLFDTGADISKSLGYNSIAQTPLYHFQAGGEQSESFPGVAQYPPVSTHSNVNKFDFSTETTTSSITNVPFTGGLKEHAGTQSSDYGYFAGGDTDPYPQPQTVRYCRSTVHKFDFSSESFSTPTTNLSQSKRAIYAVENSSYAIFLGGYDSAESTYYSTIDKLDFSSETVSSPGNDSPIVSYNTVSSTDFGYIIGGSDYPGYFDEQVKKYDFSVGSISTNPTGFPIGTRHMAEGTAAGTNLKDRPVRQSYGQFGYLVGGRIAPGFPSPTTGRCNISRLDMSSDTYTTDITDLPFNHRSVSRQYSSNIDGYILGGSSVSNQALSHITKIDFTSEVNRSLTNLSQKRKSAAPAQNSFYGYMIGGDAYPSTPPPTLLSSVDRIDFSTDIVSTPPSVLSIGGIYSMGGIQSKHNAYVIGGAYPPNVYDCTIYRMDFITETFSSALTDGISPGRRSVAAVASRTDAYLAGGYQYIDQDTYYSTINKLDFSTDGVSSALAATLPAGRDGMAATENEAFGYFIGGMAFPDFYNNATKMEFANDTGVVVPSGSISQWGAIKNSN